MKRKSSAQMAIDFIWWLFLQPNSYKARRNRNPHYRARLKIVKQAWIIVGLVMLGGMALFPGPIGLALCFVLFLVSTFAAFMFLDEYYVEDDSA